MRVDQHETVYLHVQVGDPLDFTTTPEPCFTHLMTHIGAPVFIDLTGVGIAVGIPPRACGREARQLFDASFRRLDRRLPGYAGLQMRRLLRAARVTFFGVLSVLSLTTVTTVVHIQASSGFVPVADAMLQVPAPADWLS